MDFSLQRAGTEWLLFAAIEWPQKGAILWSPSLWHCCIVQDSWAAKELKLNCSPPSPSVTLLREKGSLAPCLVAARSPGWVCWRPHLAGTRQCIYKKRIIQCSLIKTRLESGNVAWSWQLMLSLTAVVLQRKCPAGKWLNFHETQVWEVLRYNKGVLIISFGICTRSKFSPLLAIGTTLLVQDSVCPQRSLC